MRAAKTNLTIRPYIKNPAKKLAAHYGWSLSELVERLLERECIAHGYLVPPLRSKLLTLEENDD